MARDFVSTDVKGVATLLKTLDEFPEKMQKNAIRGATRKGTQVFQSALERNAPVRSGFHPKKISWSVESSPKRFPGFLRRHVRLKKVRRSRAGPGTEAYWTGPGTDAYYGMIQALGGKFRGWRLRPNPWIERAYEASDKAVQKTFENTIQKYITRYARKRDKLSKQAKK